MSKLPSSVLSLLSCPICYSENLSDSEVSLECSNCHHYYRKECGISIFVDKYENLEEQLVQARLLKSNWYEQVQQQERTSPWRHHLKKRRECVERIIQAYLKRINAAKVPVLLDLGCGDGNHLPYLSQYCDNIVAVDYNIIRLRRANLRHPKATPIVTRITPRLALKDCSIDIVFFNHVIEHLQDDEVALQEIKRVLKPNGQLVLGAPNEGSYWWQLAYRLQPESMKTTDHVHFYTLESLFKKVEMTGLKVRDKEYLGWGPPHWTLDSLVRRYKFVDDAFEFIGKRLMPAQASSLYISAEKR